MTIIIVLYVVYESTWSQLDVVKFAISEQLSEQCKNVGSLSMREL